MSIVFHSFAFFSTVFAIERSLKVITFVIRMFSLCTPNLKKITDYVLNQNKDFGAQKWSFTWKLIHVVGIWMGNSLDPFIPETFCESAHRMRR